METNINKYNQPNSLNPHQNMVEIDEELDVQTSVPPTTPYVDPVDDIRISCENQDRNQAPVSSAPRLLLLLKEMEMEQLMLKFLKQLLYNFPGWINPF